MVLVVSTLTDAEWVRSDGGNAKLQPFEQNVEGIRTQVSGRWFWCNSLEHIKVMVKLGRFPANFIHDGSDEVLELFPDANLREANVAMINN
jgi:hypothetical protein